MVKTGMQCAGIYQMRHSQLLNITQTLKIGMFYQVENQVRRDADKPIYRVIYYFLFVQSSCKDAKVLNYDKTSTLYLLIYVKRCIFL